MPLRARVVDNRPAMDAFHLSEWLTAANLLGLLFLYWVVMCLLAGCIHFIDARRGRRRQEDIEAANSRRQREWNADDNSVSSSVDGRWR